MIRRIRPLLFALALAGCAAPLTQSDADAQNASAERRRWAQQRMDDYRFTFSRDCFCLGRGPMLVTVRNDRVVDARDPQTGQPLPADQAIGVMTIDELFDRIAEAQANGEYTDIEYHPVLGYPTVAEIGTLANDAGVRYHLSDVQRLN